MSPPRCCFPRGYSPSKAPMCSSTSGSKSVDLGLATS
jgi:hypothetical protein